MKMTISVADCVGNAKNVLYPQQLEVTNADQLRAAVAHDHVCGVFKDNRRSVANFQFANVVVMDCDNEHTEARKSWVTPEKVAMLLSDISYALVPSRNNECEKDGKSARPRFHLYLPINTISDAALYKKLKVAIQGKYRFFDGNAVDAARFVYGCDADSVVWHEGTQYMDQALQGGNTGEKIPEGQRNSTMSRYAAKVIKRYGPSDRAYQLYISMSGKCDPPLEDEELTTIWGSAKKFYSEKVITQPDYIPPEEYIEFKTESLKPEDFTDVGQAKKFMERYGDELRYTDSTEFLRYNGQFWKEGRQAAMGAMIEFLDSQLADAKDAVAEIKQTLLERGITEELLGGTKSSVLRQLDAKDRPFYLKYLNAVNYVNFVTKRRNEHFMTSAIKVSKPMLFATPNDFDADPFLLNTPSCTYDLRYGMEGMHEHRAEDYITKMTLVDPGDKGSDLWRDEAGKTFLGDVELIEYVQRIAGLCAIGKVYLEALIISYGDGRNGKSTFWNAIAKVLGTYSGIISPDVMTSNCRRNIKPELAEMKGCRLLIAAELDDNVHLSSAVVKQMCSTDTIRGEKKYKAPFDFVPTHTTVLYTNFLPRVGSLDEGTWRRLIVIPFEACFEGGSDIKNYADYLVQNAGPAILKWVLEGAHKIIKDDFKLQLPSCVEDAVSKYREDNNWFAHFFEACCERVEDYQEKSGAVYQAYRAYCLQIGEFTRSTGVFYTEVERAGFKRIRKKTGRFVIGLRLRHDEFLSE